MDKTALIDKLDRATDRGVSVALVRGIPLTVSKKTTMIGTTLIRKNSSGYYDVLSLDGRSLYKDISVFDVAVIIAQKHNSGDTMIIKKVLFLEQKYSKHHSDMLAYLHCLKGAKKKNDIERMAILEDKFQLAEFAAKDLRDRISHFKRTK